MAVATGLSGIRKKIEDRRGGPKVNWLRIGDGESVKLRFISELDPDSKFYSEANGLIIVVPEHTNPKDFKRKAVCTMEDEGQCFGCEMVKAHPKTGWASKNKAYANVYVMPQAKKGKDAADPYVAVLSFSINDKSDIWLALLTEYEENEAISNRVWTLSRTGEKFNNTKYLLRGGNTEATPFVYDEDVVPYELEKVCIRNIPYAEQEAFYFGGEPDEADDEPESKAMSDSEW